MDFEELFETHARFVWRALIRLGVAPADVADASQEVFLVIHRRLPGFEGRSSLKTWIYAICLRVASAFRQKSRRGPQPVGDDLQASDGPHQENEIERRRARTFLNAVLDRLDEDKRAVFVLYELEELPMHEIAALMECPLTTAYSRLEAARKVVRAAFARRLLAERSA